MQNRLLYEKAAQAIQELFLDVSVPKAVTRGHLQILFVEISLLIGSLDVPVTKRGG